MNGTSRLNYSRRNQSLSAKLCCAFVVLAGWISAQGATLTWNGSVNSDWFNRTNWTPAAVPGNGDTVNFSSGTINLTSTVTFNGQFNWSGGTLSGSPFVLATNGVLNIEGAISMYGALTNYGTVNWQAGTISVLNNGGAPYAGAIWNQTGALWSIQCDQAMNNGTGTPQFNNAGLMRKIAGTNSTTIGIGFANSGTVDVESGNIQFGDGVNSLGGNFQTAANAIINGNLTGTFSGTINWSGGSVAASSPLTIETNGVLNIEGAISMYGALTNYGTVNWQAGTISVLNNGGAPYTGAIWNQTGALWSIQCDQAMNNGTGSPQFNNAGVMRKITGTNSTTIGIVFANTGTVDAQSGTLVFNNGGVLTGTFQAEANAAVYFTSGSFMVSGLVNSQGAGAVQVAGASISGAFSGILNWSGGNIAASSPLTIETNGVLNIEGAVTMYGALTNYGTVNWEAGTISVLNNGGVPYTGAIWNQAGALWSIQCDQAMNDNEGSPQFNNAGLMRKIAGVNTTTIGIGFANTGTVDAESGTLVFNSGGALTGTFQAEANAAVYFTGGSFVISGLVNSQGAGTVQLAGASFSGAFSGILNWTSGSLAPGSSLTVATNGILNIVGNVNVEGALTNYGTVNWQAGTVAALNNGGQPYSGAIWNQAGALWSIQCDQAMNDNAGTPQFNNAGLMRKIAGSNTTTIGIGFANSGTVDVESGAIQFGDGVNSLGGDFQTAANAFINGNLSGTISGTVNWSGGSIAASSPVTIATNGILNIEGNISVQGALTNYGTVNWQAGAIAVLNNGGEPYTGAIWNQAGALWSIQCDQAMNDNEGSPQFNNAGLMRKIAGTNATTIGIGFANSGTVDVESGAIQFGDGVNSLDGDFQTAANAFINGNLSGTISGTVNWSGGSIAASSPVTIATNGILNIEGNVSVQGALTNYGTVNWQAGAIQVYSGGSYTGIVWNGAGALWNIQCDQPMNDNAGSPQFINAGLMRKIAGTNTTTIGIGFANTGTVSALEGTIGFSGGIGLTNGLLQFGIGSPSGFGRISVSGMANLSGGVGAVLLDGYVPAVGTQFNVLTYGSATNTFTDFSGLNAGNGIYFNDSFSPTTLTLQASATNFVAVLPQVITQPAGQTVNYGATATFSAQVSGSSPLAFQWNQSGVPVAGGTNLTLTLTNVQLSQAGTYTLSVTNSAGGALSQPANLTVQKAVPVLNWTSPAGIAYGTPIGTNQLNASANVPGTFVYSPPLGTVLSAGTRTLSLTLNPNDSVDYTSANDSVNIAVSQVPLTATANNAARTFGQTNPAFSGMITGLTNGDNITLSFSCSAVPSSPAGAYSIVPILVDPNGRQGNYSVTLVNGSLTVSPGPPPTLMGLSPILGPTNGGTVVTIFGTGFEIGAKVSFGSLAALSVTVTGSNSLTAVTPASPVGLVNVILTNTDGNTVSLTNAFTFGIPPGIQVQPLSQAILPGSNVQFQVQATGAASLNYQWQFNGANLLDYGGISGSHTTTLTVSNVALAEAGNYTVMITNLYGSAISSAAALTVLVPPSITAAPQGISAGVGANVNLSVIATGTLPLSYQWYQNGALLGGANGAVLNFPNLQTFDQGNYIVVITNIAGSITSAPATLNVLNYCASAQAAQTMYPAGTSVPLGVKTFSCNSSVASPNSAAVVWIYEAGSSRNFPVTTDGSGNGTFNFTPFPGEAGLCQFAAALPGQSAPAAQGSFTLIGMSLSSQSLNAPLIVGVPQTNTITLSNLTGVDLSGISATAVGQPANVSVQVSVPPTLAGNAAGQVSIVLQATGATPGQAQFTIQFASAQGTTNNLAVNASMTALYPQLVATPAALTGSMVGGSQTLISFNVANVGGAASGPIQVLLPSAPWLSLVTPESMPSLPPGGSNQVTLALTPAASLPLGSYPGALELSGSNSQVQVPFDFTCVSSQIGALQVTVQDELSIYGTGAPNLSNATVSVNDFLTGSNIASAVTGDSGIVLFSNLVSAYYTVAVSAPDHGSFSTTQLVNANQTNDILAFLALQLVDYTWVVTPTMIPDNYDFTLLTTFQTQVPWPVLTISPGAINLCSLDGDSSQVDLVITNSGLISAQGLELVIGTNDNWQLKPLSTDLGDLSAESSIVVPMMINRLGSSSNAAFRVSAYLTWYVATPAQTNYYSTPIFVYNANPANCTISSTPALPPPLAVTPPPETPGQPVPEGSGSGEGGGGGGASPGVGFSAAFPFVSSPNYDFSAPITGAIVDVKLQIDQTAVISRDAFNATLQLNNNSGSPITDVSVTINPQDASGNPATNLFGIPAPKLTGQLNAVDGTGSMAIGATGTASWTIVPATNAAPNGSVQYAIGGTLSYVLNGQQVTIPLFPVPITVLPCPILSVDYFLQHDVYSDDPFTPQIEPSIPAALGILVKNSGQGNAYNFTITSSQPQIIENSNNLIIDFQIIGSQVGTNQSVSPSLTLDLGGIGPQGTAEGLWYLTSTLEGSFVNFTASFKHVDDFGITNTSLISGVRTHEMNHVVRITAPLDDGLPDFLVNDTTNVDALPDVVYSSDGTTDPVTSITSGVTVGTPSIANSNVTLTASVPSGYVYLEVVDPGAGAYPIASVQRSDGTNLLVGPNVWQTPERIHMVPSKPNNLVHVFDYNSTGSYTITYGLPITPPVATTLAAANITPTNATLNATVNPNGANTEVYFQWGLTTNYNNSSAASAITLNQSLFSAQDVELLVGGLPPETTNHFRVVAVNSAGTTYGNDVAFTTIPLPPPEIAPVSNQFLIVGQNIVITNHAIVSTPPVTYSLGGSPPAGATISSNGVFTWTPACAEGSTTNEITIWAVDSGNPPLSNSITFTVAVSECVQVGVGSTIMLIGQSGSIPVTLLSTVGITNLTFSLSTPANRLTNWTFSSSNATIAFASVQTTGSAPPFFTLGTLAGQTLQSPSLLGTIGFTALPGDSAFLPAVATNIIGLTSDGSGVGNITGLPGRITIIGLHPLLAASVAANQSHTITVYGNPGSNYQLAFTTNLVLTNWQSAGSVLMTNLQQNVNLNQPGSPIFYRIQ